MYANYTNLAYKLALGKTTKELKAEYGITKKSQNLRDRLDPESLKKVLEVEEKIKGMITTFDLMGKEKEEIYQEIKKIIDRTLE